MEPEAKYILVGSVTLAVIAAFVGTLIWLVKGEDQAELRHYSVYFREQSLRGLQLGSIVTMRGIKVGSVDEIEILPNESQGVKVKLSVQQSTPIVPNTRAVIETNMLTGLSTVELAKEEAPAISVSPKADNEDVILEGTPQLAALKSSLTDVLGTMQRSLSRIDATLSEENQQSITAILRNVETITGAVAGRGGEIEDLVENSAKAIRDIQAFFASSAKTLEDFKTSIRVLTSTLSTEIGDMSREFGDVARGLTTTLKKYDDPRSVILGPNPNALGPGEKPRK